MDEINKKLDDHEDRIRDLEKERTETQVKLITIEKEIALQGKHLAELENNTRSEIRRVEDKIEKLLVRSLEKQDEILNLFIDIKKNNNKNTWEVIKKIVPWLITAVSAFFGIKNSMN